MGTWWPQLHASRILYDNSSRTSASEADNGDVVGWNKLAKFILATQIGYDGKDTAASSYKLRWRNVTDGGSFADVDSTGEIKYAATSAVLSDGTALTQSNSRCSAWSGVTWQDGLENVGDNLAPDSGTLDLASDCYTEIQWALDPADAHYGYQYEFQIYNVTAGAAVGTCLAQITIGALEALSGHISTKTALASAIHAFGIRGIAGTISTRAATVARLARTRILEATANATSILAGLAGRTRPIDGAVSTVSTLSGAVSKLRGLIGSAAASSNLASEISISWALIGAAETIATLTETLSVSKLLAAVSIATVVLAGKLRASKPLGGAASTIASLTAKLTATWALISSAVTTTALLGSLAIQVAGVRA